MNISPDILTTPFAHDIPPQAHIPVELHTDFPMVIDNTAREQFVTCPTKFKFSTINKIARKSSSIDLEFGGAFAAGLEVLRKSYYDDGESEDNALAAAIFTATREFGDVVAPDKSNKTYEALINGLIAYVQRYPLRTDYVQPMPLANGKHAVEFTFAIPIPDTRHPQTGDPLLYAGRYDMLALYNSASPFGFDDKTTAQLGPQWSKQWDLSSQITGYCWAAAQMGFPVAGFIMRGQSILAKNHNDFAEHITYRAPWVIDRWLTQLQLDIKRMIHAWETNTYDYALSQACNTYSGCPYKELCLSRFPDQIMDSEYKNNYWNPLAKDPHTKPKEG